MEIVNKNLSVIEFKNYVDKLKLSWKPKYIVIHHTSAPSLAQRPNGFSNKHMENIKSFYEKTYPKWTAGPHLFIDENEIFIFSTLEKKGVHAKSFNFDSIGIEMLGDYDNEEIESGRGLDVATMTAKATAILLHKLGVALENIRFHRDDTKTSKTCPGIKVKKTWFQELVKKHL